MPMHLVSNHLAIIASGALGLTSAMIRFLAAEKDKRKIQEGFILLCYVYLLFNSFFSLLLLSFYTKQKRLLYILQYYYN